MGGKAGFLFRNFLLWCMCLCLIGGLSIQAFAQDDEFTLEEVVVTGSRIVRNNMDSPSPIVTVDEKYFDQSATAAIETQLNKLPQFTPTADIPQIAGADIQPNARNTPGEATIALRGIGANRSLVLINGRRGTPSNALGVVDINTIPSAAIQYVEAISGGASSTYGADAMAGVINFIMKDRFEGLEIDAQMGITEEGDNFEYQVSGIMGSNIANDRGNISLAFSYNERDGAYQRDRDWYREMWANPNIGGTQYFAPFGGFAVSGVNSGANNLPDIAVVNSVVDGANFTSMPGQEFYVDHNGNVFSGISMNATMYGYGSEGAAAGAGIIDNYRFKMLNTGVIGTNNVENYLINPLERYNMFAQGNYEINDWVSAFAQGYFSKVTTESLQEPGPFYPGWTFDIDPTINVGLIPAELQTILDSRMRPALPGEPGYNADPDLNGMVSGANEPFELRGLLPFNRRGKTDVFTYNMTVGLQGKIPQIDWTWEAFLNHGESETTTLMTGFVSLQRTEAIMTLPNFGKGAIIEGNPNQGGFAAATGICSSGLNPFAWGTLSQDCLNAIKSDLKTKMVMEQTIWEGYTQGPIANLPTGEMRGVLGASYRENRYTFMNDTLLTEGTSFLEQTLGLYPAADSKGVIEANEAYGELLVPILKDVPLVKSLNLELGGRRSDYNTTGGSNTYKALLEWRGSSWVRFRGGFNRAERTPNVAELYLAPEQMFDFTIGGDVCSVANLQAWSANPDANPEHWKEVMALCGQLMEASGNVNADNLYYGTDYRDIIASGDKSLVTANQPGAFAQVFPVTVGNPDLIPETGDTWTFGVVIDSPFEDKTALSDWRISIDYYSIEVNDAIGQTSTDLTMRKCTDPKYNPTFDINSPYCKAFDRKPTGELGKLERTFENSGRFETSGIDLNINWGMQVGPGRLGVNSLFNYLISMKSAELPDMDLVDYAGTYGTSQNGLNGNSFEWRMLTNISYDFEDVNLTLRWQHLDSLQAEAAASGNTTNSGAPSYDLFDLLGTYQLTDSIMMRFGIENLLGKEPPLTGVNTAPNPWELAGGAFDATNHDINGRRFYVGARVYFE